MALQYIHCPYDFFECAFTPPHISFFFETLYTYCKSYVAKFLHILCEGLIDERSICEGKKHAVVMDFSKTKNVFLPHCGLSTRVYVHVGPDFLALPYNPVVCCKIKLVALVVFGGPASYAFQIAPGRRIHQNSPWYVAVVFLFGALGVLPSVEI